MITPREYTQSSRFPFEPRQMRFMMRGQRPPLKVNYYVIDTLYKL